VQFAKRVVGRRQFGGQSTYIPLKVNQAGIVPIIFASSVLYLPALVAQVIHWDWLQSAVDDYILNTSSVVYMVFFALMILGFAYFYNAITFDPAKQADQIRKQGGFIPGIRPGPQTERYLARILSRLTLPGAIFIALIAIMPSIILAFSDVQIPLGGTTVLIAVGVALETMRQIDSQLMMRNYEGFLK
jgi:preprotein translocase subunit SecY